MVTSANCHKIDLKVIYKHIVYRLQSYIGKIVLSLDKTRKMLAGYFILLIG
ncbi:hypothetical protein CCYN2B_130008 [Capnocytophaga cynodegmi]|uniref:Uncharacterized protein n=1 Tax=Capnocytophaga cynodegmi TaxID=28189 RepID=A0A0B7H5R6_9FLAO|nr:hypothetical protein CCYN2B_130008 [Capnocytophaga cynodegmi]